MTFIYVQTVCILKTLISEQFSSYTDESAPWQFEIMFLMTTHLLTMRVNDNTFSSFRIEKWKVRYLTYLDAGLKY
jgi:hypothetical protein